MITNSSRDGAGTVQFTPAQSDSQFYSTYLINIDWPPNFGRNALAAAAAAFPHYH